MKDLRWITKLGETKSKKKNIYKNEQQQQGIKATEKHKAKCICWSFMMILIVETSVKNSFDWVAMLNIFFLLLFFFDLLCGVDATKMCARVLRISFK